MSLNVDLCVWPDESMSADLPGAWRRVLECVPVPKHTDYDGSSVNRFERLRVAGTSSELVYDEALHSDETSSVLEIANRYVGPGLHFEVKSAFDYVGYSEITGELEPTVGPLMIHYYGPEYEWQGSYYKRFGPIRLCFSNTKTFRVSESLIAKARNASINGPPLKELQQIATLSHNFDGVEAVVKNIIEALNPLHLLVCTDQEVHPLTAHAIYHRNWRDYSADLLRIATLHEQGGLYFCEVPEEHPAFADPRAISGDYGYIRRLTGTTGDLMERVQTLAETITRAPESIRTLSREEIEASFDLLDDTEVETLGDSFYLSVGDAPFGYLEEPYFRLFDAMRQNVNRA